jgi:Outer membrane protein beta-barrel domain
VTFSLKTVGLAVLSLMLIGAAPGIALAQNEVEIGWNYQHLSGEGDNINVPLGAGVQVFHPVSMMWGVFGGVDFGRKSTSEQAFGLEAEETSSLLSLFVGPRVTRTSGDGTVFGQVGIGLTHQSFSAELNDQELFSDSSNDGMLQFEGGYKSKINDTWSLIGQAGLRHVFGDVGGNAFRVFAGVGTSF